MECEVVESSTDVLIGVSKRASYVRVGKLQGHLARVGPSSNIGVLDAGIPHYKHGGVVAGGPAEEDAKVEAWSSRIGQVTSSEKSFVQFKISERFSPMVDGERIRGISHHIYPRAQTIGGVPPVYLIPQKNGQFQGKYNEGDVFVLSLH
jgi:hypothetical protein